MARDKLTRPEQRFNYGIAISAVVVVVVLVIASPHVQLGGVDVPILLVALLVGAFLFGLGQMVIGITRRRRYLRSLDSGDEPPGP